jgi:hypothetical protein
VISAFQNCINFDLTPNRSKVMVVGRKLVAEMVSYLRP